jgi:hypothetical protein
MKSIFFKLISTVSILKSTISFVSAQNQDDPYYANDCAVLKTLYQNWNQAAQVTWNDEIGSCCDEKNIVCDPHHGYSRIAELKLRSKNFSGPIPSDILKLKYLNYLSLADNQLTGEIPENIDELTYLTKFSFRNNNLSGKIPDSIGNIDGIFHLDFALNQFTGKIPDSFGNLKQLQFLNLSSNLLEGYIPESFKGLKKLTTLQLKNTNLQGYVPLIDSIGNCTYDNTKLCYQEGASCVSTASLCTDEEIQATRKNNGYSTYSESNSNSNCNSNSSSNSNSSCNCNNGTNKGNGGFFSSMSLLTKILIGCGILILIGIILYCIFGRRKKSDNLSYDMQPTRANYNNFY